MRNTLRMTAPGSSDRLILALRAAVVGASRSPRARLRSGRGSPWRPGARSALGAHALEDAAAPVLLQARVHAADLRQDRVRHRLLLLARGVRDRLPANRVAVLDGDARKLQPLPVAYVRGAVNRDRHHRGAALERQAADPGLCLLGHFSRARAAALAVHHDRRTLREELLGGDERLLVTRPAAYGE